MNLRIAEFDDEPSGEFDPQLADAVRYGDTDRVRELLLDEADPNAVDSRGEPLLLVAILNEHPSAAVALTDSGARTDVCTASGATPLWLAAGQGYRDVVKALIDAGAAINQPTHDFSTPTSAALQAGFWSLADELQRQGGVVLEQDFFHSQMNRSYAKPDCDLSTLDDENFQRAIAELQHKFKVSFLPLDSVPGVYQCDDVTLECASQIQEAVQPLDYSLVYHELTATQSPTTWLLTPTNDKYPIVRALRPFSRGCESDNQSFIWVLVEIDEEHPFELVGCGHTFIEGRFRNRVVDVNELSEQLALLFPKLLDAFGDVEKLAKYISETNTFRLLT